MNKTNENKAAPSVDVPRLVRPSVFDEAPLHMDTASRNERLYETLLKMGLFVEPVKGPSGGISKFIVSCGLPS
jgi:hypothetical protein